VTEEGREQQARPEPEDGREQLHRHVQVFRRNAKLIAAIVATVTLGALLLSLMLPKSYSASARLVLQEDANAVDSETIQRRLATGTELVTSRAVARRAAARLPGMTPDELAGRVSAEVSPDANLIEITGTAQAGAEAAAIANTVAQSFLAERASLQRQGLARQREVLREHLRLAPERPGPGAGGEEELRALEQRIDELAVSEATAGSDLRLVEPATTPLGPSSPRPLVATLIALFASLVIAILVALGREHLVPRARGQRDVGRILGVPVLAGVPELRRRPGGRTGSQLAAERDAFDSLRNAIELATPPMQQKVIVVTSATVGEGKTTVAHRLAKSLVTAGQSAMLVSADLRRPSLHEHLGLPRGPGLSDLLATAAAGRREVSGSALARATRIVLPSDPVRSGWARLAVLPSGEPPDDPSPLLTTDLVLSLFQQVAELDYEWVLVDAPPLLGPVDARVFAGAADALLLVSRLGVVTVNHLMAERDELDRLEVDPLGVVVVGAPLEAAVYDGREPRQQERYVARGGRSRPQRVTEPADRAVIG
jgi:polysaccharide biosynthesis transport protein